MNIQIYISEKKLNKNHELAMGEYLKRLQRFAKVTVKKNQDIGKALGTCSGDSKVYRILVTPGALSPTSPMLAEKINGITSGGCSSIYFFVMDRLLYEELSGGELSSCGENGLPAAASDGELLWNEVISISSFDLSCGLTTVVLTEQIYRAFCILNHITYHK